MQCIIWSWSSNVQEYFGPGTFCCGCILSAGWCNGNILASHAADRGSIPGCVRSASHQTVSGTASAGDAHSLVRRINPPTASSVPRCGVAQGYRKGDEHLRQPQHTGATWPCIVCIVTEGDRGGCLPGIWVPKIYGYKFHSQWKFCCLQKSRKSDHRDYWLVKKNKLVYSGGLILNR